MAARRGAAVRGIPRGQHPFGGGLSDHRRSLVVPWHSGPAWR
jgi:hypothetical protein